MQSTEGHMEVVGVGTAAHQFTTFATLCSCLVSSAFHRRWLVTFAGAVLTVRTDPFFNYVMRFVVCFSSQR